MSSTTEQSDRVGETLTTSNEVGLREVTNGSEVNSESLSHSTTDSTSDVFSYHTAEGMSDTPSFHTANHEDFQESTSARPSPEMKPTEAASPGNQEIKETTSAKIAALTKCVFFKDPERLVYCDNNPDDTDCLFCKNILKREHALLDFHLTSVMELEYAEKLEKAKEEMKKEMVEDYKLKLLAMKEAMEQKLGEKD